jgi:hypothetical protein
MLVEGFLPRPITTISAATKAAACVLTVAAGNADRLVPGASVYITGTSFALLDGKWHKISAAAGTSVTLATATTAEAGTFTAGGALSVRDTPTPQ